MVDTTSPLAALSLVAGPALLTNASSVLLLGTINRYGRALDRARALSAQPAAETDRAKALMREQSGLADKRVLTILRSMTSFYIAVGAFGTSTLTFLLNAALGADLGGWFLWATTAISLAAAALGVSALIIGTMILALEGRLGYRILKAEVALRNGDAP
jgi:hypothetical protein